MVAGIFFYFNQSQKIDNTSKNSCLFFARYFVDSCFNSYHSGTGLCNIKKEVI
nr:MAG TPA: hypothetical protein [Caudoviricetes sp.]